MAIDITVAVSGNAIKNGTVVASAIPTGEKAVLDTSVLNSPIINDIELKYENRFDDPTYYSN